MYMEYWSVRACLPFVARTHDRSLTCAQINFVRDVSTNEEAEAVLLGLSPKAYFFWKVPFEDNLFRLTYVTQEGPFSAPVQVIR